MTLPGQGFHPPDVTVSDAEVRTGMYNKDSHLEPPPLDHAHVEHWRPIEDYEGLYDISCLGNVRSLPRQTKTGMRGGKILARQPDGNGYWQLRLHRDGRGETVKIYWLVARAFKGVTPPGQEIRHGPLGKTCDAAWNLSFGTRAQNEQDKKRDGTFIHGISPGERNGNSKLTAAEVLQIRARASQGQVFLAREFGVTQATVSQIIMRKTWRHI